jgi:hypothetical protein
VSIHDASWLKSPEGDDPVGEEGLRAGLEASTGGNDPVSGGGMPTVGEEG